MTVAQLESEFEMLNIRPGSVLILAPNDALAFVRRAEGERFPVLGIDGFQLSGASVQPDLSHSVDYSQSSTAGNWHAAGQFVREHTADVSGFEIVLGENRVVAA